MFAQLSEAEKHQGTRVWGSWVLTLQQIPESEGPATVTLSLPFSMAKLRNSALEK